MNGELDIEQDTVNLFFYTLKELTPPHNSLRTEANNFNQVLGK